LHIIPLPLLSLDYFALAVSLISIVGRARDCTKNCPVRKGEDHRVGMSITVRDARWQSAVALNGHLAGNSLEMFYNIEKR
jgi:hypothetical protein